MDLPRQPTRSGRQASLGRPKRKAHRGRAGPEMQSGRWTRYGRLASKIVGGVAAVVGLLLGIISLVDWMSGKLDHPPPRPPAEIDASIDGLKLASVRQPLADYLETTGQSTAGLTPFEGRQRGLVFDVHMRLKGSVHKKFGLRWLIVDRRSGSRLRGPTYNQTAAIVTPKAQEHARTWPIWVPYPPRRGSYRLTVILTNNHGQPVADRSEPFDVAKVPRLE